MGPWQGTLYLPLRRGSNELVLAVADVFGGWGMDGPAPRARRSPADTLGVTGGCGPHVDTRAGSQVATA